ANVQGNTTRPQDNGGSLLATTLRATHHHAGVVKLGFSFRQDHRVLYHGTGHSDAFHTLCAFVDIQRMHARLGLCARDETYCSAVDQAEDEDEKEENWDCGFNKNQVCDEKLPGSGIGVAESRAEMTYLPLSARLDEKIGSKILGPKIDKKIRGKLLGLQAVTRDVLGCHLSKAQQCSE
ncbi:hypothetical protein SARC_17079, partial [Sphaeroforma arctica JP610]